MSCGGPYNFLLYCCVQLREDNKNGCAYRSLYMASKPYDDAVSNAGSIQGYNPVCSSCTIISLFTSLLISASIKNIHSMSSQATLRCKQERKLIRTSLPYYLPACQAASNLKMMNAFLTLHINNLMLTFTMGWKNQTSNMHHNIVTIPKLSATLFPVIHSILECT